jgi:hypothetical protein
MVVPFQVAFMMAFQSGDADYGGECRLCLLVDESQISAVQIGAR